MSNTGQHNRDAAAIRAQIVKANANGRAFEDAVSFTCARWREIGVAKVRKAYASSRTGGYGGGGGSAPVDFTGTLHDGTAIAFECKNITRTANYTHDKDRLHQVTYLRRVRALGGLAFVLLYDSDFGVAFIVADLEALSRGEAVPVRWASEKHHEMIAYAPTTEVVRADDGTPVELPGLLVDAQLHCAKYRVRKS